MINMQKFAVPSIEHTPTQYGLLSMQSYEFRREEGIIAGQRNAFGHFRSPTKTKIIRRDVGHFPAIGQRWGTGEKN